MAKPSRWNAEKRYQIVKEALSQKEPMGQIARRHPLGAFDGGLTGWLIREFFDSSRPLLKSRFLSFKGEPCGGLS